MYRVPCPSRSVFFHFLPDHIVRGIMIDSLLLYNIVITVFKNYLLLDRNFVKAYSKNITCYTC